MAAIFHQNSSDHDGEDNFSSTAIEIEPLYDYESPGLDGISTKPASSAGLSTLAGVFAPCVMSIFGVILFERYAWVFGHAGLIFGILIVGLSYAAVTLTAISLSAIATNGDIKGGGAYYMISRSLGPAFGGSIGVIFYCANVAAGGTYLLGLIDAIQETGLMKWSEGYDSYFVEVGIGSTCLFLFLIVAFVGAGVFAKSTLVLFVIQWVTLVFVLISFAFHAPNADIGVTGWSVETLKENLRPKFEDSGNGYHDSFQSVFAVFFPATTGIMAGANMSGDLANPRRSIPKGTLYAILTTSVYYLVLGVVMVFTTSRTKLAHNYFIMQDVCFWSPIFAIGVIVSTSSSALNSLIGGARILQAFAKDELVPGMSWFARGSGKNDEPRIAVAFTWFLMQIIIFGGKKKLNLLATMTSMFFLLSYGVVNLACFVLRAVASPNFRPSFKYFDRYASLLGACCCIGGMFYVSPGNASLAVIIFTVLYAFIAFRAKQTSWGDISQAIIYHQVRKYLLQLDVRKDHMKYWRPQILLFVSNPQNAYSLIDFTNNLKKSGLYMLGCALVGDYITKGDEYEKYKEKFILLVDKLNLKAFPEVIISSTLFNALQSLLYTAGIGMMKPNTIVLGFPSQGLEPATNRATSRLSIRKLEIVSEVCSELEPNATRISATDYIDLLREAIHLEKNVLIARNFSELDKGEIIQNHKAGNKMSIDLWIPMLGHSNTNPDRTFHLILLLGHILKQTDVWNSHTFLCVKSFVLNESLLWSEEQRVRSLLQLCRIRAHVEVYSIAESGLRSFDQAYRENKVDLSGDGFEDLSLVEKYEIINELVQSYSCSPTTACTFFPLPSLPSRTPITEHTDILVESKQEQQEQDEKRKAEQDFIANLRILSAGSTPTLLVHGTQQVITNEL